MENLKLFSVLIAGLSCLAIALSNPINITDPDVPVKLSEIVEISDLLSNGSSDFNDTILESDLQKALILNAVIQQLKLRQEEGLGGLELGSNVGEIISGVLGGGLGNIFSGSLGFLPDNGVQEEAQFVLKNIAPPLEVVLNYGWAGLKQYFGIGVSTTPSSRPMAATATRVPQLTQEQRERIKQQFEQRLQQQQQLQQQQLQQSLQQLPLQQQQQLLSQVLANRTQMLQSQNSALLPPFTQRRPQPQPQPVYIPQLPAVPVEATPATEDNDNDNDTDEAASLNKVHVKA